MFTEDIVVYAALSAGILTLVGVFAGVFAVVSETEREYALQAAAETIAREIEEVHYGGGGVWIFVPKGDEEWRSDPHSGNLEAPEIFMDGGGTVPAIPSTSFNEPYGGYIGTGRLILNQDGSTASRYLPITVYPTASASAASDNVSAVISFSSRWPLIMVHVPPSESNGEGRSFIFTYFQFIAKWIYLGGKTGGSAGEDLSSAILEEFFGGGVQ